MVESMFANAKASKNSTTIAFVGKTGAGKTTLMNALAKQELGKQASRAQMTSQTTEITVYPSIAFLGDPDKPTNFVDLPGLLDTEGRDQEILDKMVEDIKSKCPSIDMMLLCFEKGKFDTGVQKMIQTYVNLLDKGSNMWKNIIVVITKVTYLDDDYEDMGEWIDEMERWKHNFRSVLSEHYKDAHPTVLAIS